MTNPKGFIVAQASVTFTWNLTWWDVVVAVLVILCLGKALTTCYAPVYYDW